MLQQLLCLFVLTLQALPADAWKRGVDVSAKQASKQAMQAIQRASTDMSNVEEWMHAVSTSQTAFDCSESSLKRWTDQCSALAESSHARAEMAAALTLCEIKSVSSMNIPKECLDWIDTAATAGPCIECVPKDTFFDMADGASEHTHDPLSTGHPTQACSETSSRPVMPSRSGTTRPASRGCMQT